MLIKKIKSKRRIPSWRVRKTIIYILLICVCTSFISLEISQRKEIISLSEEIMSLQDDLNESSSEVKKLGDLNKQITSENEKCLKEKEKYKNAYKELKTENENLKKEIKNNARSTASVSSTSSNTISSLKTDSSGKKYYEVVMRITAYCSCASCCGVYAHNRPVDSEGNPIIKTASGATAVAKYTLSASTAYAFGTKMEIPGIGVCEVQDRGGAITGNKLDLYFASHEEANNWGVRTLTVKVYK